MDQKLPSDSEQSVFHHKLKLITFCAGITFEVVVVVTGIRSRSATCAVKHMKNKNKHTLALNIIYEFLVLVSYFSFLVKVNETNV